MLARLLSLVAFAFGFATYAAAFTDVLAIPAIKSELASKTLVQGVARAGSKLVAVGQRGHIVVSGDGGTSWKQSAVPVSSDLTAVFFASDTKGWAVGHDGVILASADGGETWTLQFDGMRANAALVADLERKATAQPASETIKTLLADAHRYQGQGSDKPFLDVWFADDKNGFVVGAYNLIFKTDNGGATWTPWFDRTDNPKYLNLYAIRPAAGGLYIAGEGGLVLRLDSVSSRFRAMDTGYQGTYFGVTGDSASVLVFGMRGNAYRSDDAGSHWTKADTGLTASIVSGVTLGNHLIALADATGHVTASADGGRKFAPLPVPNFGILSGIADVGAPRLALFGARGVAVSAVATAAAPSLSAKE
jgi:photosystem II stability/assembly factor-like uncharacterized protein